MAPPAARTGESGAGRRPPTLPALICKYVSLVVLLTSRFISVKAWYAGFVVHAASQFYNVMVTEPELPSKSALLKSSRSTEFRTLLTHVLAPATVHSDKTCVNCSDNSQAQLPCSHILCRNCLQSLLEHATACPRCGQQIVARTALSLALLSLLRANESFWTILHHASRVVGVVCLLLWLLGIASLKQCLLIFYASVFFEGHMTSAAAQRFKQMEEDLQAWNDTTLLSEITIRVVMDFVMISIMFYYIQKLFTSTTLSIWRQYYAGSGH